MGEPSPHRPQHLGESTTSHQVTFGVTELIDEPAAFDGRWQGLFDTMLHADEVLAVDERDAYTQVAITEDAERFLAREHVPVADLFHPYSETARTVATPLRKFVRMRGE